MALVFSMIFYNVPQLFGFDLCFFYQTIYISFRLDLCKSMCMEIGRTNEEKSQIDILLKVVKLHIDTDK